jgi:DNA transformation protein and related proteins
MAISNDFLEYVLDQFSDWGGVTVRKMFGGAGLYRDGKMFGLVSDNVAFLKVDETNRGKFIEAGSEPFKPFANRPTMRSFYEIPPDIFENQEELIEWSEESLAIQKKVK